MDETFEARLAGPARAFCAPGESSPALVVRQGCIRTDGTGG